MSSTVTSSLIDGIVMVVSMAESMKTSSHMPILMAIHDAIGPGGKLPAHYQLALLPINELDELHTKVVELFRKS